MMTTLLVLHGPNLNLLGTREPEIYGAATLEDIDLTLREKAKTKGLHLASLQSNAEHELIDRIHKAKQEGVSFIVFNPGAFTHTSVALRDALMAVAIPFIEVHLSNIYCREDFRKTSFFSDIAEGVICGFGPQGYELAIDVAIKQSGKQSAA